MKKSGVELAKWAEERLDHFVVLAKKVEFDKKKCYDNKLFSLFKGQHSKNDYNKLINALQKLEPLNLSQLTNDVSRDFQEISVLPDGNCFYRAISKTLLGNENTYFLIKTAAVYYMIIHLDKWKKFFLNNSEGEKPLYGYIFKTAVDRTWTGEFVISVVCSLLNRPIIIYEPDMGSYPVLVTIYLPSSNNLQQEPISLSLHDHHFNVLANDCDYIKYNSRPHITEVFLDGAEFYPGNNPKSSCIGEATPAKRCKKYQWRKRDLRPVLNKLFEEGDDSEGYFKLTLTETQIAANAPKPMSQKQIKIMIKKWRLVSYYRKKAFYAKFLIQDNTWQPPESNNYPQFKDKLFGPVKNTKDVFWVDNIVKALELPFPSPQHEVSKIYILRWLSWGET